MADYGPTSYGKAEHMLIFLYRLGLSCFLAAIACVLRPTNVLIWVPIGLFSLWHTTVPRRQVIVKGVILSG